MDDGLCMFTRCDLSQLLQLTNKTSMAEIQILFKHFLVSWCIWVTINIPNTNASTQPLARLTPQCNCSLGPPWHFLFGVPVVLGPLAARALHEGALKRCSVSRPQPKVVIPRIAEGLSRSVGAPTVEATRGRGVIAIELNRGASHASFDP